jgi:uncharacterized protein involved in outer membrane biogenesis
VTSLHLNGARLAYSVDELGRHQWIERDARAFDINTDGSTPVDGEPVIRDVRLADVQFTNADLLYDNERTQQTLHATEVSLHATLASLADPLKLSVELDLNDHPVVLMLDIETPERLISGEGARVAAEIESVLLQANLDLEAWVAPHLGANGQIDVQSPAVGKLAQWLDQPLGQTEDPGALRLSGKVSSTETRATLHALTLSSADWDLAVSGSMAFDEVPTHFTLNIEGDRVDLDRYLPEPVEAPRRAHLGSPYKVQTRDGLDDPIDLSALQDFEGDVRIALDGLKVRNFEIGQTAFRAKLEDKVLAVELGELSLYGGRLVGQMSLDVSSSEPAMEAKLAIDRVDIDNFYEGHPSHPIIGGEFNGAVNVTSHGRTPRALIGALTGAVLLELDPSPESTPAHQGISKANLQLLIPEDDENPYLLGRLFYRGKEVTFDIETAPLAKVLTERGFGLDASLQTDLATLAYKGDVYQSPILSFDGDLNATVPSAGRLAAWFGSTLPEDPGPVSLKASFESNGTTGRITEAYLKGDDLSAEVSGDFDFSGAVSKFDLQAKTGVLRIDRYLPQPGDEQIETDSGSSSERNTVFLLDDVPDDPLDLAAFRQLNGQIEIVSEGVVLPGAVVGGIVVGFHTNEGLARLDIDKLIINEGTLAGTAQFDGRQSIATAGLNLKGAKLDFDALMGLATGEDLAILGQGDITMAAKAKGGSLKDLLTSLSPSIELNLASVTLNESQALEVVALKAQSDSLVDAFHLAGTGTLRATDRANQAIAINATSDPVGEVLNNENFAFQGNGTFGELQLQIKADVEAPLTHAKPTFEVHSAGDSLGAIASILEAELPTLGPYKIAARITSDGAKTELSSLDLTLGRSRVSGKLSFDDVEARTSIAGQLTFETLDLTEFYEDQGLEDIKENESKLTGLGDRNWIFQETPLPFELLSEADITDLKVTIATLRVDSGIVIEDISSNVTLKDATFHLSGLRGRIYNGDITGDFKAKAGAASPSVDLTLKGANLDYGVFLKAFDVTERLRGALDLDLTLEGYGTSLRAIAAGLNGRIDVNARDGQIDRKMLGLLAFGTGSILGPLIGEDDTGKLDCIVTSFTLEDGLADTLVNYYETSFFAMAGDGQIDLKTETLDFVFNPKAREVSLMKLVVPFRVSGSLQSPDVEVDAGGTLFEAVKTAGTIAAFINPLVGLGVLAGQAVLQDREGCETANMIQRGEIPVVDPEPKINTPGRHNRR